jgi:hypothetical protein
VRATLVPAPHILADPFLDACVIASSYASQLEEEESAKAPKYALGHMEPLRPYNDGHYAFTGSNAAIASHNV